MVLIDFEKAFQRSKAKAEKREHKNQPHLFSFEFTSVWKVSLFDFNYQLRNTKIKKVLNKKLRKTKMIKIYSQIRMKLKPPEILNLNFLANLRRRYLLPILLPIHFL